MDNTDKSYYDQLFLKYDYIISQLEISFLSKHRCSRESELYLNFHDILLPRVKKFMRVYQPPKNYDENWDMIRGFITQFRNHIYYTGCVYDSYTKTNKLYDRYVNIVTDEEKKYYKSGITPNQLLSDVDMEEQIIQKDEEDRLRNGFDLFSSYLTTFEKMYFKGMNQGENTLSIIKYLSNGGFDSPSYDISKRLRETIEYKLTCFFAQEREMRHDEEQVLKTLNKCPRLNKKVYGVSKLNEIPSQELLERVFKNKSLRKDKKFTEDEITEKTQMVLKYDSKSKIQVYGKEYFSKSKIDFNGKKHDHYVVYFDQFLNGYCHITKQTKNFKSS